MRNFRAARVVAPGNAAPRVVLMTVVSMVAFAGNSLLCRMALKHTAIDATSFTVVRLLSGAGVLWLIVRVRSNGALAGSYRSAFVLFAYAIAFSFAYIGLSAGMGALLLFGAAQATMIFHGIRKGERLGALQLLGLACAIGGLVALLSPGLSAPPLDAAMLMLFAGAAWGVYCILSADRGHPLAITAGNFVRCVPFAVVMALVMLPHLEIDARGVMIAVLSGAIASGLAYAIWYTAMRELSTIAASVVQLTIPIIASAAGVAFLGERITLRLLIGSLCVLGGVAMVLLGRRT